MKENKEHWYDGIFYDKLIAPNQDRSYRHVKDLIEENSSLLDAGCGTGRLGFQMYDKCGKVTGIDLSAKNIETANRKLKAQHKDNLEFIHTGIESYFAGNNTRFDYSVLSYVIHEVPESERAGILRKLIEHSERLIIIDYLVPRPRGFWSVLNEIVEFAAGRDHYFNFKNYVKNNGIKGLAKSAGLTIENEIINSPSASHFVVLKNTRN